MSYLNPQSIVRTVSTALGLDKKIDQIVLGEVDHDHYMPNTVQEYRQVRRYFHDLVCHSLLDAGLYTGQEPKLEDFGIIAPTKSLRKQKPDLIRRGTETIVIGEVATTYNYQKSMNDKSSVYNDYLRCLRDSGVIVDYQVHVLDMSDPEWMTDFPRISPVFQELIESLMSYIRFIHLDPRYSAFRSSEETLYSLDKFNFVMTDNCYIQEVEKATGIKTSCDIIKSMMGKHGQSTLTDEEYINTIAHSILINKRHTRPVPHPESMEPSDLIREYKREFLNKPQNTKKVPRILQLGAPKYCKVKPMTFDETKKVLRNTSAVGGYLDYVKSSLEHSDPDDGHLLTLALSSDALELEQSQGPGRKTYLKKRGLIGPKTEEPTHIGVKPSHVETLVEFIDTINQEVNGSVLDDLKLADSEIAGVSLSDDLELIEDSLLSSGTSTILMFYQMLSKEITLNGMRRRKTRQYALFYTGCEGIFGLIAPGSQLRTESNTVFVKIMSLQPPIVHQLSAPWRQTGNHWESDWLSVDTDRLAHWQRSFDRVSISALANVERLVDSSTTLKTALNMELGRNYGLLALTYLENKRTTSTTNQTIRYLWMKSLGDKQLSGIMGKFPSRVNSFIQSFMIQRSVETCVELCRTPLADLVKTKALSRDAETGLYDETTTGVPGLFPRLFTFGNPVPVSYNLNEIYWCMAYNKDRQNSTQDAMGIITKILKEEQKYTKEIGNRSAWIRSDICLVQPRSPRIYDIYTMRSLKATTLVIKQCHVGFELRINMWIIMAPMVLG